MVCINGLSLSAQTDSLNVSKADSLKVLAGDTLSLPKDSLSNAITDSLNTTLADSLTSQNKNVPPNISIAQDGLDAVINYKATDSIVFDIPGEKIYLYGTAKAEQDELNLEAHEIIFSNKEKTLTAKGRKDSLGNLVDVPHYVNKDQDFYADEVIYNFETKKGKLRQLLTQEGEGFLRAEEVKKNDRDELFGKNAYYTTCNHEDPHYRIEVDKVKLVPNKVVVSGPANLVIDEIQTPLFLPFAIFPLQEGRTSGIILPTYGESPTDGFFFRNMGLYFGINDYVDLLISTDIYTEGRRQFTFSSKYKKRYRYNGNMSLSLGSDIVGDTDTTDVRQQSYYLRWNHSQDIKARPHSRFSANVNVGTSRYTRDFQFTNNNNYLSNTLNSSINYQHDLPGTPFRLQLGMTHSQNLQSNTFNITLPRLRLDMTPQQFFRRKKRIGKERWYERIKTTYSLEAKNQLNTIDSLFFAGDAFNEFQNGISQRTGSSVNFKLFKYFNWNIGYSVNNRVYFKTTRKVWEDIETTTIDENGEEQTTIEPGINEYTVNEVRAPIDYTATTSLGTTFYGLYKFRKGKLKGIRHEVRPSLSFNYRPDFSEEKWDYYKTHLRENSDGTFEQVKYSIFEDGIYGGPPQGRSGSIGFGINNVLQMKVFSKKDTVNREQKINILDRFNIRSSYNLAVDSFNMSNINITGGTRLFKKININFNAGFDPYIRDQNGDRRNIYEWTENRRFAHFNDAGIAINTSLRSDDFGISYGDDKGDDYNLTENIEQRLENTEDPFEQQELENLLLGQEDYIDYNIPWNLSLRYNLKVRKTYPKTFDDKGNQTGFEVENNIIHTIGGNLSFSLTPNWKFDVDGDYDFVRNKFSRTSIGVYRNLHCWEMRFNWVPNGSGKYYLFELKVRSSLLQDLKITRRRSYFDY